MGSLKLRGESIHEAVRMMDMEYCSKFTNLTMESATQIITQVMEMNIEVNDELLSKELYDDRKIYFGEIETLDKYSLKDISYCYRPLIKGGDNYNTYLKTISDHRKFGFDVFTCSIALKINNHCCHFVRTLPFQCSNQYLENHRFIKSVFRTLLTNLQHGKPLYKVYEATQLFAEKLNADLAKGFEKEFGFKLGPNCQKKSVTISSNSTAIAEAGMFFAINMNLTGLREGDIKYNMYYTDTVLVRKDQPPRVFTYLKPRRVVVRPLPLNVQ